MKRTALLRRTPLARKAPIPRGATKLARVPRPRAARRDTGFDRATGALICDRDEWRCQGCGVTAAETAIDRQHRVARQTGGRHGQAAEVINSAINGVLLCRGRCHARCEQRDPDMHKRGLWLRQGEDPTVVPIVDWQGRAWLLLADGRKALAARP